MAGDQSADLLGSSYRSQRAWDSTAVIAEQAIARDIAEEDADQDGRDDQNDGRVAQDIPAALGEHSMAGHFRRPSFIVGGIRPFLGTQQPEHVVPIAQEYEAAINEERSLLRDNALIPAKHPRRRTSAASGKSGRVLRSRISIPGFSIPRVDRTHEVNEDAIEEGDATVPSEGTPLIGNGCQSGAPYGGEDSPENIGKKWEEAVMAGKIKTSWQRETTVLLRYAGPGLITFILQNSLTMTSIFTVGHIGKIELGAVSLGSMTANITGYAIFHGLTTSLDTLCPQAFGSGRKQLVGLQLQRMVFFLWSITIPIAIVWAAGTQILGVIVPEAETARLAGLYLKVLILGAPAYALFESSKRYVQAMGHFEATTYVLMLLAPLNVFLHWLFVWHFQWGFIGCPIAVVITENLLPILLFLYVRFFCPGGMDCWPGFTKKAFRNWGPMIRLALPGLIMVMAEFLAFEALTLSASWISATHLAANTVLQTLSVLTYSLPFPVSIAASTRVANLIGAGLPDAAKVTTRVAFIFGAVLGVFNMVLLSSLRGYIPWLFTGDQDVAELATKVLPVNAAFQLFDALAAICNGILRGLGRQEVGGYINLGAYYVIALPVSFATGFGLNWELYGLWAGPAIGLGVVSAVEGFYIHKLSYEKASEDAANRIDAG